MNALHPGVIRTGLGDSPKLLSRIVKWLKRFWKPASYVAQAPVWLATSQEVEGVHGLYFNEQKEEAYIDKVLDEARQKALME